jgi:hypothetical protein
VGCEELVEAGAFGTILRRTAGSVAPLPYSTNADHSIAKGKVSKGAHLLRLIGGNWQDRLLICKPPLNLPSWHSPGQALDPGTGKVAGNLDDSW